MTLKSLFRSGYKTCLTIFFTLLLLLSIHSCKKHEVDKEKVDPVQKNKIFSYHNSPITDIISFDEFKRKVNINTLGSLKVAFEKPLSRQGKLMAINTADTYAGFAVQTDNIKVIKANEHTSYIFPVKLSTPRATIFQNLTIDVSKTGTLIFINTYIPTQKWISEWKSGHPGKFDGNIGVTYLNSETDNSVSQAKTSATGVRGKIASATFSERVSLADGSQDCTTTTYYYQSAYNCASGRHGPNDSGCALVGDERAGYVNISFEITSCNGGGGGGGTSPTPPNDYDPCSGGGTPPSVSYNGARGAKLMVHQNPDCNPQPPVTPEPTDPQPREIIDKVKNPCLKAQTSVALNAKTTIRDMLNTTFGGNQFDDLELEIRDTTNLNSITDAEMQRLSGLAFEIRLNENKLPNASKEYIVSTVYHEILHAFMESKLPKDSNGKYIITDQHQDMATKYVTLITGALKIAFPNLSSAEAWALSWGGLEKTPFYTTKLTDEQRNAITNLNNKHKSKSAVDKLGTYCN